MLMYLVGVFIFLISLYWRIATQRPKRYPPGPNWLPIIGNASLLRKECTKCGSQIAVFRAWKEKYQSSVIGLKLGRELVVVALSYPVIHQVHTSDAFDGRPDNFFFRLRTMGSRLGITSTDGELWNEQRNFVSRHLRKHRSKIEDEVQYELNELLSVIQEHNGNAVWPGSFLSLSVLNVLWTFATGKKMSRRDQQLQHLLDLMKQRSRAFDMSGGWLNTLPFLRFIAPEKTKFNLIKRFNGELSKFLKPVIDEHKREFSDDKINDDLIFAFINEMNSAKGTQTNFTDIQLTMVILDLFIAGAQSTSNTLDFILMTLVMHDNIQKKCHREIDTYLGAAELPTLQDKSKLAYIEAVILETQRFYNIVPVSGPRRVLRDTTLDGYSIPKNTTVLIGLEIVNSDEEIWGDPHVFRPERFLDGDNNIVNTDKFVAYGKGKRRCLGEALARACLFSFTVGILQKFQLEIAPDCKQPQAKPLPGLLSAPAPYEIVFRNRLI